ncbi:hypothetical protein GGR50DRAFT_125423 [Xylaria sp. CBS 124048]|nr:hypothetical protein GGR50DRAFT_125423 [Xylaria sp. CBS 124048]
MATSTASPIAPSAAVQIPNRKIHNYRRSIDRARPISPRKTKEMHSPNAIPPAVAALLAVTNIPPPKRRKGLRQLQDSEHLRMTVDAIVPRSRVSEKDLSQELRLCLGEDTGLASFEQGPLDFLLTPPDELVEEETFLHSESGFASPCSRRTRSFDSLPSLEESLSPSVPPSVDSPLTPRRRRLCSPRRSLEPVTTPPGEQPEDPLSKVSPEDERLDFAVLSVKPITTTDKVTTPFKSVFKSNLTASLRALRSAARSLSTFTTSLPPDDLLTRSILTIDPMVPFADEKRPPMLEEEPSEAMRRYLNPASNIRPEVRGSSPIRSYTASIQMQTYRVQRTRGSSRASRQTSQSSNSNKASTVALFPPGPRQREVRENPDFIRIAVIEQLMRKRGKLDDQREGHARWLLPPRKAITKPYELGPGGVPVRWVPMSQDD